MTYLKYFLGTESLNRNSVQQNYSPELYPCIVLLTKNTSSFDVTLLLRPSVDGPPFPQTFVENPGNGGRILPYSQKFNHFPHQMSFHSHQIAFLM